MYKNDRRFGRLSIPFVNEDKCPDCSVCLDRCPSSVSGITTFTYEKTHDYTNIKQVDYN